MPAAERACIRVRSPTTTVKPEALRRLRRVEPPAMTRRVIHRDPTVSTERACNLDPRRKRHPSVKP
jgi:hypothetical protein